MSDVHLVVPAGIDDPAHPSGGNVYDRRLRDALPGSGWRVREHGVEGTWPVPGPADRARLARVLAGADDGAVVLIDGLIGCAAAEVVVPECGRLEIVVLVHLPLGIEDPAAAVGERAVLIAVARVLATSPWTCRWLAENYGLRPDGITVAVPGVDGAEEASGTVAGGALLFVGAATAIKGYDVLIVALAAIADLSWTCTCVGDLGREPELVAALRPVARRSGIADRVLITGPRSGASLADTYAAADLLVVPSRQETFGMVVSEALARAVPVLASSVGGLPEAIGLTRQGRRPGLLVPPADPEALAAALRGWLGDAELRARLRDGARERRTGLPGWSVTAGVVDGALRELAS